MWTWDHINAFQHIRRYTVRLSFSLSLTVSSSFCSVSSCYFFNSFEQRSCHCTQRRHCILTCQRKAHWLWYALCSMYEKEEEVRCWALRWHVNIDWRVCVHCYDLCFWIFILWHCHWSWRSRTRRKCFEECNQTKGHFHLWKKLIMMRSENLW